MSRENNTEGMLGIFPIFIADSKFDNGNSLCYTPYIHTKCYILYSVYCIKSRQIGECESVSVIKVTVYHHFSRVCIIFTDVYQTLEP